MSYTNSLLFDGSLNVLANNGNRIAACSADPDTYVEANSTYRLGYAAMTTGDGNGDYVLGDRQAGGRQAVVAEQEIAIAVEGTVTHIAILDTVNQRLLVSRPLVVPKAMGVGEVLTISAITFYANDAA
jgi:hypothetical protein